MASLKKERLELDAYEILLIQCILRLKAGIPDDELDLSTQHFKKMTKISRIGLLALLKIFGKSSPTEESRYISFNENPNGKLIYGLVGARNLVGFKKDVLHPDADDKELREHVPKTYPGLVIEEQRRRLAERVTAKLKTMTMFSQEQLSGLDVYKLCETSPTIIPTNLVPFLYTTWNMYIFFPYNLSDPKIIRSVMKINSGLNNVETFASKAASANDYLCTMRFDKDANVLIFNGKTRESMKRDLHIKLVVGNKEFDKPPEILLGEYSNIEASQTRVHSGRVVFSYAGSHKDAPVVVEPDVFSADSAALANLENPIKEYLMSGKDNFRITPVTTVYTVNDLQVYLKEIQRRKYERNEVRLQPRFRLCVSMPRYNIESEEFEGYREQILQFVTHLEETGHYSYADEDDYFLRTKRTKEPIPKAFDYYVQRVEKCEILIVFLPKTDAYECLAELALGIQSARSVYLIVPDQMVIPTIYQRSLPKNVLLHDYGFDKIPLCDLGNHLINSAPYSEKSGFLQNIT